MSLMSCPVSKIAYFHILKNLGGPQESARFISRTYMYIGGYSAGAGSGSAGAGLSHM